MKRLFILASAAALMLASCAKTTVVYNEAPEEISFKQVTNVMTKEATLGDRDYLTMGVFAYLNNTDYFTNGDVSFAPSNNVWVATPPKYWPLSGSLDFVYYAPFKNDVDATLSYSSGYELSIPINNSSDQTDWMYGTEVTTADKSNDAIDITLRHALAKITVNVISDLEGLKVTSLSVLNTNQSGTLSVDYSLTDNDLTDGDSRLAFDITDQTPTERVLFTNFTANQSSMSQEAYCYVIPGVQTSIKLVYQLTQTSPLLAYTHSLTANDANAKWVDGKHYTYTINITANEIKFNPTETAWADETPTPSPIVTDPNAAQLVNN